MLWPAFALAQSTYSISGFVKDAINGEAQIGVSVYVKELGTGVLSNDYGFYSLTLPPGTYTLVFSSVGYEKQTQVVGLTNQHTKLTIELRAEGRQLQEVVVLSTRDENVKNIGMGVNTIPMRTIQRIPALLGEVDVVRSIQLLPGVSTVGEGATGFNVRGGSIDQNLVLLDEAPVYNSSHLFGFFSVFNPDAVKDVKLIKAGIPAQYGGRLSSILDVRMKEGNTKKAELSGGIGLIFSRLSYQHPLFSRKGGESKGSFIVAARRSYADILAKPFLGSALSGSKFYFYDLTAKINYKLNDKNTLYLSGYLGRDVFGADFGFNWGNATTSFRWNHVFNTKLFLNTTAFYSKYDYAIDSDLKNETPNDFFRTKSSIVNYSVKPDFTLYLPKHTLNFGGQTTLYDFQRGNATTASEGRQTTASLPSQYALESALYVSDEFQASSRIQLQYGLRYSLYSYLGPGEAYTYATDVAVGQRRPVAATQTYTSGQSIQTYGNLEPRLGAKYELNSLSSIKASYNRLAQYVHLISNTTASTPLDVWTTSTNNIKPQLVDQLSAGYYRNFGANALFEVSAEVYYKSFQNQIDYIDGANLVLNKYLEGDLLSGKGRAYGAEFYLKKTRGIINGWVSYTLAKTERQVEGINNGNWYPTRFDRRHNVNVVLLYDPSARGEGDAEHRPLKRWSFAATFALASGTPTTFPTNRFYYQGLVVPQNADNTRNNYRIPVYHRLDLSATLEAKRGLFGHGTANWVFSFYNVYGRKNPFSVYFQQNADNASQTEAIRYAIIGSVIPSVSYNFKF